MKHDEAKLLLSDRLLGELDADSRRAVDAHLAGCAECRELLAGLRMLREELARGRSAAAGEHPAADELVAYFDPAGALPTPRMAEIALHLRDCAACAEEARALRPLLTRVRRRLPRPLYLAAALIVLAVVLVGWRWGAFWRAGPPGKAMATLALPAHFDPAEAEPIEGKLDARAPTTVALEVPLSPLRTAGTEARPLVAQISRLPDGQLLWTEQIDPARTAAGAQSLRLDLPAGFLGAGTYELEILDAGEPLYFVRFRLRSVHGGKLNESEGAALQLPDGGYLLASGTYSFGSAPGLSCDGWLVRLNATGDELWSRTYGGEGWDGLNSIRETPDGNFVCTGYAGSAFADLWLLKVSPEGEVLFDRRWGTEHGWDNGRDLICTADGGYAVVGYTRSFGKGPRSVYFVKTDASGRREWDREYGGEGEDTGVSVLQMADGGYLVGGTTTSSGAGGSDLWVIRTDAAGSVIWDRTYGDSLAQSGGMLLPARDGDFYLLGSTQRDERLDFNDGWLLKIAGDGQPRWSRRYGGEDPETFARGIVLADGSLVIAGSMAPGREQDDVWLLGLDANGDALWEHSFGGPEAEAPLWLEPAQDRGLLICASTRSYGAGDDDLWLIRTDASGIYATGGGAPAEQRYWSRVLVHAVPAGMR